MAKFGAGPMDYTCACFAGILNRLESGLVWKAQARMEDQIDVDLVESWISLQSTMIERLELDTTEGRMTEAQFEMALSLLTNLDRMEWAEVMEQFQAWAAWVRGVEVNEDV